ncbi:acetyltransferase [Kosakonia cowanii]|uniref:acetyltransferase n=1 Tax=Kosakonia cowanii TaxID=208223 RepID=UPI002731206F|nr:acetyltransferase [Kosakonia cowanii]WKW44179.1 acetyltransferase [Kosakonia cowanii]
MMKLAIYGAGGLGREVYELVKQLNAAESRWSGVCFIDDINPHRQLKGQPVVTLQEISPEEYEVVVGVGEPNVRHQMAQKALNAGFRLATVIHPLARVSDDVTFGEGTIVCDRAYVSCDCTIGKNVYLQPNCNVGHDCVIGDDSIISAYANLGGNCLIGTRTYIGLNAAIRETTTIGDDTIISMGAIVFNDIGSSVIALGNPARVMRANEDKKVFR